MDLVCSWGFLSFSFSWQGLKLWVISEHRAFGDLGIFDEVGPIIIFISIPRRPHFRKYELHHSRSSAPNFSIIPDSSQDFPGGSDSKVSACNVGDLGSVPGSGRSPGGGHGNLLQYSCLENPWVEEPGGLPPMGLQSVGSQRVGHD